MNDYVPDITERPWYTAAQPYRDPNAPEYIPQNLDDKECNDEN